MSFLPDKLKSGFADAQNRLSHSVKKRTGEAVPGHTIKKDVSCQGVLGTAAHKGWLQKTGYAVKNWTKRYFVLNSGILYYFKTESSDKQQGEIELKTATSVERVDGTPEVGKKPFAIAINVPGRVFYLVATNEEETTQWLEALREAVNPESEKLIFDLENQLRNIERAIQASHWNKLEEFFGNTRPLVERAGARKFETNQDLKKLVEKFHTLVEEAKVGPVLEGLKKEWESIENQLQYLTDYYKKKDVAQVTKRLNDIQSNFNNYVTKYGDKPEAAKNISETRPKLEEISEWQKVAAVEEGEKAAAASAAAASAADAKKAAEKYSDDRRNLLNSVGGPMRDLESNIKREDWARCEGYIDKLAPLVATASEERFASDSDVRKFLASYNDLMARFSNGPQMAAMTKEWDSLESAIRWLKDYYDKKDLSQVTKRLGEIKPKYDDFVRKYGEMPEAQPKISATNPKMEEIVAWEGGASVEDAQKKAAAASAKAAEADAKKAAEKYADDRRNLLNSIGGPMRDLDYNIKREDWARCQGYIDKLLPLVDTASEERFASDNDVQKFLASYKEIMSRFSSGPQMAAMTKEWDSLESAIRWLKDYYDKKDLAQVSKRLGEIKPKYDDFVRKYSEMPEAETKILATNPKMEEIVAWEGGASVEDAQKKAAAASAKASEADAKKAAEKYADDRRNLLNSIGGPMSNLEYNIKREDWGRCDQYIEKLSPIVNTASEARFAGDAEVQKFLANYNALMAKLGSGPLMAALSKEWDTIKSDLYYLNGHFERKEVKQTSDRLPKSIEKFNAFKIKFGSVPEAQDNIKEAQAKLDLIESSLGGVALLQNLDNDKSSVASKLRWVVSYYDSKNLPYLSKSLGEIDAMFRPFCEKYGSVPEAATFIAETRQTLDKIQGETGGLFAEQEINAEGDKIKSNLRWLKQYLDDKKPSESSKKGQDVRAQVDALMAKHGQNPLAIALAKEAEPLLKRVDDEVAPMIAQYEVDAIISSATSQKQWLERALNDRNVKRASEIQNEIGEKVLPLRTKYSNNASAQAFLTELDALLAKIDKELGAVIAQLEIESAGSKLEGPLNALQRNLDMKDLDRIIQFRDEVEKVATPVRKYGDKEPVKSLLAKADALFARVENELGDMIAGREINKLLPAASSVLYYTNQALEQKNVQKVKADRERIQSDIDKLAKYEKYPEPKEYLTKARALVAKIDSELGPILAQIELEKHQSSLSYPMKAMEDALAAKDVKQIIKAREALAERAVPLKSSLSNNAAAKPLIAKVDALLDRCDNEAGELVSAAAVQEVKTKVDPTLDIAKQAAANKDEQAALASLQRAAYLIHPLSAQYPKSSGVAQLVAKLDEAVAVVQPKLNDYAAGEVNKISKKVAEELATAVGASFSQKSLFDNPLQSFAKPVAVNYADFANIAATCKAVQAFSNALLPLRKSFAWNPAVRNFLLYLDTLGLKYNGRIIIEEEFLPQFEVSIKTPSAVQTALNTINSKSKIVNEKLNEAKKSYGNLDRTGGVQNRVYSYDLVFKSSMEPAQYAAADLQRQYIPELEKADPTHIALPAIKEAVGVVLAQISSLTDFYKRATDYVSLMTEAWSDAAEAAHVINAVQAWAPTATGHKFAGQFEAYSYGESVPFRAKKTGGSHKAYDIFLKVWDTLQHGEEQVQKAIALLKDDHSEADILGAEIKRLRQATIQAHVQLSLQGVPELVIWDAEDNAQHYIANLKHIAPNAPELKTLDQKIVEARVVREKTAEARKAEANREYEEARAEQLKELAQTKAAFKDPYTSNSKLIGATGDVWEYNAQKAVLTCTKGQFAGDSFPYKEKVTENDNRLEIECPFGRLSWSIFSNMQAHFYVAAHNTGTVMSYKWKPDTKTWKPTNFLAELYPDWILDGNKIKYHNEDGNSHAEAVYSEWTIEGDMPPPVWLAAVNMITAIGIASEQANQKSVAAMCDSCSHSLKGGCVSCGKNRPDVPARVCENCNNNSGSKCIIPKCGKHATSHRKAGYCSFQCARKHEGRCARCGNALNYKWAPFMH